MADSDNTHSRPLDIVLKAMHRNLLALGGSVLEEPCRPSTIAELANRGLDEAETNGCGGMTRLAVPYTDHNGHPGFASVCALDDCAYYFPRLRETQTARYG